MDLESAELDAGGDKVVLEKSPTNAKEYLCEVAVLIEGWYVLVLAKERSTGKWVFKKVEYADQIVVSDKEDRRIGVIVETN